MGAGRPPGRRAGPARRLPGTNSFLSSVHCSNCIGLGAERCRPSLSVTTSWTLNASFQQHEDTSL